MSTNIQIFEEYGPVSNGRGTVAETSDFNLGRSNTFGYPYYFAPLRRPLTNEDQTLSYQRYFFFRISGNPKAMKDVKLELSLGEGKQATETQLFYRFTNTYQEPTNAYDGKMMYTKNQALTWYPNLSSSGPQNATSRGQILIPANSDLYTQYLVLQMRTNSGGWSDVGNTDEFKLTLKYIETE
jgi:hypothetical protein